MEIAWIQFVSFFQGISCLLFLPNQTFDYIDALDYCASKNNSVLSNLSDAMLARNRCMLTNCDVWYKRKQTDPDLGSEKPDGMCYVYGSYWKPCREKLWFFCNDGENPGSVQCSRPTGILACSHPAGKLIDRGIPYPLIKYSDDHTRKNTNGKSTKQEIDFNFYEWMIIAGAVILAILVTLVVVGAILKCRKPKQTPKDKLLTTSEDTGLGKYVTDSKWYEGTHEFINEPPHIYDKSITEPPHIYDKSIIEPPHIYDKAEITVYDYAI
ncbi:uncharacterized protein LOC127728260 [Mytilus californianus]|uniref:uncharacterized protein LOC127728260 n=1 Tax=Mytilus californianus TaxID=6549 RepID=UPI0022471866|nr:uncharacterized protein LOC127728260 [Mytilus californianus]